LAGSFSVVSGAALQAASRLKRSAESANRNDMVDVPFLRKRTSRGGATLDDVGACGMRAARNDAGSGVFGRVVEQRWRCAAPFLLNAAGSRENRANR
jgi:hypothetical protein